MDTKKKDAEVEKPVEAAAPKPKAVDPLLNDDSDEEGEEVGENGHPKTQFIEDFAEIKEISSHVLCIGFDKLNVNPLTEK